MNKMWSLKKTAQDEICFADATHLVRYTISLKSKQGAINRQHSHHRHFFRQYHRSARRINRIGVGFSSQRKLCQLSDNPIGGMVQIAQRCQLGRKRFFAVAQQRIGNTHQTCREPIQPAQQGVYPRLRAGQWCMVPRQTGLAST